MEIWKYSEKYNPFSRSPIVCHLCHWLSIHMSGPTLVHVHTVSLFVSWQALGAQSWVYFVSMVQKLPPDSALITSVQLSVNIWVHCHNEQGRLANRPATIWLLRRQTERKKERKTERSHMVFKLGGKKKKKHFLALLYHRNDMETRWVGNIVFWKKI